ncbi:MAG: superoxide dismutase family protein [Chloroflexia bacterium]
MIPADSSAKSTGESLHLRECSRNAENHVGNGRTARRCDLLHLCTGGVPDGERRAQGRGWERRRDGDAQGDERRGASHRERNGRSAGKPRHPLSRGRAARAGLHNHRKHQPRWLEHGLDNPNGPHDGDLPAIEVEDDGTAEYEAKTDRITLSDGDMSVFDDDGSALIIHADPDDQTTDPTGNSGDRVACGALELMELPDTGAGGTAANGGLPLLPAAALGLLIVCSAFIARRRFAR